MTQFNYLQALYGSFYSKALYRDVEDNWGGGVFVYLLILLLICWGALMVRIQPVVTLTTTMMVNEYAPQVPHLSIKNGIVTTPANRPYLIKDLETNKVVAIVDTSGQYKSLDTDSKGVRFLMTRDHTYSVDNNGEVKSNKISNQLSVEVDPMQIKQWVQKWIHWLWVILLPIIVCFSFVYRIISAIIYAVIGKLLSFMGGLGLTYAKIYKLVIVSMTPSLIVGTLADVFNYHFPKEWIAYFLLALGYLVYAMWVNKSQRTRA